MSKLLLASLLCLTIGNAAAAPANADAIDAANKLVASLHPQDGRINLYGGLATLDLPPAFRYLSPDDSARLLAGWGNPPGAHTLGMIVPAGIDPMSFASWGVVITYDKDGHIKDDDADGIDYTKLLKDMQESVTENNAERKKQGYRAMTLIGWAETPHYDKPSHKLYWAKEVQSEGSGHHGLNYNIRVLGREGVLVLNAVADIRQLNQIRGNMQQVNAFTNFTVGNRYADFNGKTDKVAEYGVAALVAGGVAAKLGLFGKLFAILLAFKKLIVVGVAALGSSIVRFFKRTPKAEPAAPKVDLSK